MIRPLLAATALGVASLIAPTHATATQEQNLCQNEAVGCSAGPQLCATIEYTVEIYPGMPIRLPLYCYQSV